MEFWHLQKLKGTTFIPFDINNTIYHFRNLRDRYDSAKEQLAKGEKMFDNVLKPLADISDAWTYLGFVSFPEIENKKVLNGFLKLSDIDLKVKLPKGLFFEALNYEQENFISVRAHKGGYRRYEFHVVE